MKILIYDDNQNDVISIKKIIDNYFFDKSINYDIYECTDTSFLLRNLNNYDLIFLDIEINAENGIDIGKEVRKLNADIRIIIISNYSKYLIEGYKIQADRYFLKPINQEEFNIEFENVINRYLQEYESFFNDKIYHRKIYFKEILYIEFLNRKSQIHLLNSKIISTNYPLKFFEENLNSQRFAKPHKSFLVNLQYLSGFSKNDIILITNEKIPLSRHYKHDFDNDYLTYLQGGL